MDPGPSQGFLLLMLSCTFQWTDHVAGGVIMNLGEPWEPWELISKAVCFSSHLLMSEEFTDKLEANITVTERW